MLSVLTALPLDAAFLFAVVLLLVSFVGTLLVLYWLPRALFDLAERLAAYLGR